MALSTYSDLKTAVATWLHRADMTTIVPDLILLGERRIFREVRCNEMETALSSAIASGVIVVPSGYLELKFAYIDGSPTRKLQRASASQIYEQYPVRASGGKPRLIAREGTNFIFGPYPDSTYTVKGVYYAEPASIQSSANSVFLAHPDLYLMAALCEASPYLKDDQRVPLWEQKYAQIKTQISTLEAKEYGSGGGLRVSVA